MSAERVLVIVVLALIAAILLVVFLNEADEAGVVLLGRW